MILSIFKTLKSKNHFRAKAITLNTNPNALLSSTISFVNLNNITIKPHSSKLTLLENNNYIDHDRHDKLIESLLKITTLETKYYKTDSGFDVFPKTFLIIETIAKAQVALKSLEVLDSNKIAFYEENKSGKIPELIDSLNSKIKALKEKIEITELENDRATYKKELSILRAKKLLAMHKKKHPFIVFLLMLDGIIDVEKWNLSDDERMILKSAFNFARVGYATKNQILNSAAIIIADILKNTFFTTNEIKQIIKDLFLYVFDDSPKNLSHIADKNFYLKNMVNGFPIFDSQDEKFHENYKSLSVYFKYILGREYGRKYGKLVLFPFIRVFIAYPLFWYQVMLHTKIFGIKRIFPKLF
ncbi:MAG: hypothetical protein AB7D29_06975 [Campylobacterales bacterium]